MVDDKPRPHGRPEPRMSADAAWLWGALLVWVLLQKFVFPRLGVPT